MSLLDKGVNLWWVGGGLALLVVIASMGGPGGISNLGQLPRDWGDLGGGGGSSGGIGGLGDLLGTITKETDVGGSSGDGGTSTFVSKPTPGSSKPKAKRKPGGSPPATGPSYGPGNLPPGAAGLVGKPDPTPWHQRVGGPQA